MRGVVTATLVVCPACGIPFIRHGAAAQSSTFYRTQGENDTCIVCREGLDPDEWLPSSAEAAKPS